MKIGDRVKFHSVPANHFFYSSGYIMQSRKSGEVYPASMAPEVTMMQIYEVIEGDRQGFKKGDLTEDYFNNDFFYLGGDKDIIDKLIIQLTEQGIKKGVG